MYIRCKNNINGIKIVLPPIKNKKSGSKIYIKNESNKNIFIFTNEPYECNNLTFIDNNIIVRPFSLVKIISINNNIYLINKI